MPGVIIHYPLSIIHYIMGKDRKYEDKVFGIGHKKSELPAGGIRLSIVLVVVGMGIEPICHA